jgi:hypothetical protein
MVEGINGVHTGPGATAFTRIRALIGRVIDEDIQSPEFLHACFDQGLAMPGIADVSRNEERAPASPFDPFTGLPGVVMFFEIRDEHVGAFASESDSHSTSNA